MSIATRQEQLFAVIRFVTLRDTQINKSGPWQSTAHTHCILLALFSSAGCYRCRWRRWHCIRAPTRISHCLMCTREHALARVPMLESLSHSSIELGCNQHSHGLSFVAQVHTHFSTYTRTPAAHACHTRHNQLKSTTGALWLSWNEPDKRRRRGRTIYRTLVISHKVSKTFMCGWNGWWMLIEWNVREWKSSPLNRSQWTNNGADRCVFRVWKSWPHR